MRFLVGDFPPFHSWQKRAFAMLMMPQLSMVHPCTCCFVSLTARKSEPAAHAAVTEDVSVRAKVLYLREGFSGRLLERSVGVVMGLVTAAKCRICRLG